MESLRISHSNKKCVRLICTSKLIFLLFMSLFATIGATPPFGRRHGGGGRRIADNFEEYLPLNNHEHQHKHHHYHSSRPPPPSYEQGLVEGQQFEIQDGPTKTTVEFLPDGIRVINEPSSTPSRDADTDTGFKLDGFVVPGEPAEQVSTGKLCPDGKGFHRGTGRCYKFATSQNPPFPPPETPCGELMDYYRDPTNKSLGVCDCKEDNVKLGVRPLVYWKPLDRCYLLFDQGPCSAPEEWLILNDEGHPVCRRRTCPQNEPVEGFVPPLGTGTKFWFRERGKCYQTRTADFCNKEGFQVIFENHPDNGYVISCADKASIDKTSVRFLTGNIKDLPCKPGYKRTINGECSREATFE